MFLLELLVLLVKPLLSQILLGFFFACLFDYLRFEQLWSLFRHNYFLAFHQSQVALDLVVQLLDLKLKIRVVFFI